MSFLNSNPNLGDTVIIDASLAHVPPHRHIPTDAEMRGFPLKAYSLLLTTFDEVLFLDSDNTPIVDPSFLFDDPSYREKGNLFWPDVLPVGRYPHNNLSMCYDILGLIAPRDVDLLQGQAVQMT